MELVLSVAPAASPASDQLPLEPCTNASSGDVTITWSMTSFPDSRLLRKAGFKRKFEMTCDDSGADGLGITRSLIATIGPSRNQSPSRLPIDTGVPNASPSCCSMAAC